MKLRVQNGAIVADQKPSVGRVVHYKPMVTDPPHNNAAVLPAIITAVWSDTCVNLRVINDQVWDFWKTSANVGDLDGQWNWPPRV
jgi:hypothetical protein